MLGAPQAGAAGQRAPPRVLQSGMSIWRCDGDVADGIRIEIGGCLACVGQMACPGGRRPATVRGRMYLLSSNLSVCEHESCCRVLTVTRRNGFPIMIYSNDVAVARVSLGLDNHEVGG